MALNDRPVLAATSEAVMWSKNFTLICVSNLFLFLGFQMLMPTLPIYVKEIGGNETMVGLMSGIFCLSSVASRPFIGKQLDTRGRKGILAISLAVIVLITLSYYWTHAIATFMLVRLLHGFAWSGANTAGSTTAADVMPDLRRGEGMGYYWLFAAVAMAIAPGLGLWIIGSYNFALLFVMGAALALASLLVVIPIRLPALPARSPNQSTALLEPTSLAPSAVLFFVTFAFSGTIAFLSLYAVQLHISNIGIYYAVFAVVLVAVRPVAGRLMDKRGPGPVVIPGLIFLAGSMMLLVFARDLTWFLASAVCNGVGYGATQPILQALTINRAPLSRRGAASATFLTFFDVGIGSGSIVLGVIAQYWGFRASFLVAAAAAMLGLVTFLAVIRPLKTWSSGPGRR
ncbi:MAG: MFS transporter [Desulfobacterales bacterium]|nr:MFS transporter [Desulfobacterales bacterium]